MSYHDFIQNLPVLSLLLIPSIPSVSQIETETAQFMHLHKIKLIIFLSLKNYFFVWAIELNTWKSKIHRELKGIISCKSENTISNRCLFSFFIILPVELSICIQKVYVCVFVCFLLCGGCTTNFVLLARRQPRLLNLSHCFYLSYMSKGASSRGWAIRPIERPVLFEPGLL